MATTRERREVAGFDTVKLEGSGVLIITQGEVDGLEIETDPRLLSKIKSEVVDGRLAVGFRSWLDYLFEMSHPTITYYISMRELRGVSISGSGKLNTGKIATDRLSLRISGAGDMLLDELHTGLLEVKISGSGKVITRGAAPDFEVRISGAGEVNAAEVEAQTARVRISGSGNVQLKASETLDVHISGSGDVRYSGDPKISQTISGSGSIRRV